MIQQYDSSMISPWELPIIRDVRDTYMFRTAKDLCIDLLKRDRIEKLTDDDYENIRIVANGGMWRVPDTVYDDVQWTKDGTLKCVAGQEISESIYYAMLNVLPPLPLRFTGRARHYSAGFLVSELVTSSPDGKNLYSAYGKRGDHYYYIGL